MVAALIANGSVAISEFAGIAAGLELFGIPRLLGVPVVTLALWWIIVGGNSERVERIFVTLHRVLLRLHHQRGPGAAGWGQALSRAGHPHHPLGLGEAAPGGGDGGHHDHPLHAIHPAVLGRRARRDDPALPAATARDVVLGERLRQCGRLLHHGLHGGDAAPGGQAGPAVGHRDRADCWRRWGWARSATYLFALGLFGASLIAAAIVPLSTAFSICEAFGWESGVRNTFREAPVFYTLFSVLMVIGMVVGMWPGLPMVSLLVAISALNGVLLPVLLLFIMRLINNRELMGAHVNRPLANCIGWSTWSASRSWT